MRCPALVGFALVVASCGRIDFAPASLDAAARLGEPCHASSDCAAGLACTASVCSCLTELRADEDRACGMFAGGALWCWGGNADGQLGIGTTGGVSLVPVEVAGLPTGVVGHDEGAFHSCAWTSGGELWCWGRVDVDTATGVAYQVPAPPDVVEVASGGYHSCLRTTGGQIWCWGRNADGQLGQGMTGAFVGAPVQVPGIDDAIAVASGGFHSCAIRADRTVWCWGLDTYGQVGDGQTAASVPSPVPVPGLGGIEQITAGDWGTCARDAQGTVWCWGRDGVGQTGDGAAGGDSLVPRPVVGLPPVIDVYEGDDTACAFDASGALWCWGDDSEGELADGAPGDFSARAVAIAGIGHVLDVAVGRRHVCALIADGTTACWGRDTSGELGDGMMTSTAAPVTSGLRCP